MRRTSLCVAILLIAAGRRGTDARDGRHGHAPRPGRRVSHGQPDRVPMRGLHDGRTVIVEGTMKPATATIFLALLLTACAPAPAPAPSPRIVFMSMRDGNWEIYLMNVDGSKQINLTNHPEQDMSPACSRDGRRIAFESGRDGNQEIYAMKDDGSDQTRLTNSPQSDQWPAWTPDGRIGYCSDRDTEPVVPQLFVMDADGQEQARLLDDDYSQADAAWSPDGARIAFNSMQNGRLGIYVMNADGSGVTRLTANAEGNLAPEWCP